MAALAGRLGSNAEAATVDFFVQARTARWMSTGVRAEPLEKAMPWIFMAW
jgi:hypothetical protein